MPTPPGSPGIQPVGMTIDPGSVSPGGSVTCTVSFSGSSGGQNTNMSVTYRAWNTNNQQSVAVSDVLDSPPSTVVVGPSENPKSFGVNTKTTAPTPTTVEVTASANGSSTVGTFGVN